MTNHLTDSHVTSYQTLSTPQTIKIEIPISEDSQRKVEKARSEFTDIITGRNKRLAIVLGPCSIHDVEAGLEYARKLKAVSDHVSDKIFILMRVYFTKPRTTTGWKGLINDPHLDDSFKIDEGLRIARKFLNDLVQMGIPTATEALDAVVPQYIDDLISWHAIGARTTESQTHREMASGLSTPVGFKNGTDGNVTVAINAMKAASEPHHFLGISAEGRCSVIRTTGNPHTHVVLRGGAKPNYDEASVKEVSETLSKAGQQHRVIVDCSHGNSLKDHTRQAEVFRNCLSQFLTGTSPIFGLMLESNLVAGNQSVGKGELVYGQSITDACIGWDETESLILEAYKQL